MTDFAQLSPHPPQPWSKEKKEKKKSPFIPSSWGVFGQKSYYHHIRRQGSTRIQAHQRPGLWNSESKAKANPQNPVPLLAHRTTYLLCSTHLSDKGSRKDKSCQRATHPIAIQPLPSICPQPWEILQEKLAEKQQDRHKQERQRDFLKASEIWFFY